MSIKTNLILIEHTFILNSTRQVISNITLKSETLQRSALLVTQRAQNISALFISNIDIDKRAIHGFIDTIGPESAIEMRPLVDINGEETARSIRVLVATRLAEYTQSLIGRFPRRRCSQYIEVRLQFVVRNGRCCRFEFCRSG